LKNQVGNWEQFSSINREEIIWQKIMEMVAKDIMVSVIHLINYFLKPLINSVPTIPGHFGPVY
jgi:hypothetical protein